MKCTYNGKDRKNACVKDMYSIAMLIYSINEDVRRNEGNEVGGNPEGSARKLVLGLQWLAVLLRL
jgi:hypothetical protein